MTTIGYHFGGSRPNFPLSARLMKLAQLVLASALKSSKVTGVSLLMHHGLRPFPIGLHFEIEHLNH